MDATHISAAIEKELAGSSGVTNWHGITRENICQYLVPPHQEVFQGWDGNPLALWVVLDAAADETPYGYLVVFNGQSGKFGLAVKSSEGKPGMVVGFYGTFLQALAGM